MREQVSQRLMGVVGAKALVQERASRSRKVWKEAEGDPEQFYLICSSLLPLEDRTSVGLDHLW